MVAVVVFTTLLDFRPWSDVRFHEQRCGFRKISVQHNRQNQQLRICYIMITKNSHP